MSKPSCEQVSTGWSIRGISNNNHKPGLFTLCLSPKTLLGLILLRLILLGLRLWGTLRSPLWMVCLLLARSPLGRVRPLLAVRILLVPLSLAVAIVFVAFRGGLRFAIIRLAFIIRVGTFLLLTIIR